MQLIQLKNGVYNAESLVSVKKSFYPVGDEKPGVIFKFNNEERAEICFPTRAERAYAFDNIVKALASGKSIEEEEIKREANLEYTSSNDEIDYEDLREADEY